MISDDDDVVIDESKTTAIANRNLCFGMIQSLVVTLYPRHLEYIEGKSDRVIIKRATTANKASLAVEHEGGLVGCSSRISSAIIIMLFHIFQILTRARMVPFCLHLIVWLHCLGAGRDARPFGGCEHDLVGGERT